LARADAGGSVRSIAEALQISSSCVTKWKNLRRDTGGLSPGQIGYHKTGSVGCQRRLAARTYSLGPFTLRKRPRELPARGSQQTWERCGLLFTPTSSASKKRFYQPSRIALIVVRKRTRWKAHQGRIAVARFVSMAPLRGWGLVGSTFKHLHLSAI
jgi:hypothetical protein